MAATQVKAPGTASAEGPKAEGEKAALPMEGGINAKAGDPRLAGSAGKSELQRESVERSPLSMNSAASLNTATAFAGPRPWNREWIFDGGMDRNPDLQPLLEKSSPKAPEAAPALAQLAMAERKGGKAEGEKIAAAEIQADSLIQSRPSPQATDPSLSTLRSAHAALTSQGLEAQLQALSGELLRSNGAESAPGTESAAQAKPGSSDMIGGAEFLGTLQAVRGPRGQQSGLGGQDGGSQQDTKSGLARGLHVLDGGRTGAKGRKSLFEEDVMSSRAPVNGAVGAHHAQGTTLGAAAASAQNVTGHVVKGRMSQDRLSSESLSGLSLGIRKLSPQGGGEIRMRLNPEHLGELNIRVRTENGQVGLQIHASDERARKVIEESISHLKDSMAAQQLTLGQIDLSVGNSAKDADVRQDQQQQRNNAFGDLLGQDSGRDSGRNAWSGASNGEGSDRWGTASERSSAVRAQQGVTSSWSAAAERPRYTAGAGRIDVRA